MESTQPVAARNAITTIDDKPQFELTANEIIVRIGASDSPRFLLVHLRPYTIAEMKKTLRELKASVRDTGQSLIQEDADPAPLRRLVDSTFVRLSHITMPDGSDPSPEQQRAWLAANPRVKARIANEAFATVVMLRPIEDFGGADDDVFVLLQDAAGTRVRYLLALYDPMKQMIEGIEVMHCFEPDTETDYQVFDRASRKEIHKVNGAQTIDIDYDALERLYNRTIIRVDGMRIAGEACTAVNRDKWLPLVPLWQKVIALTARFDDVVKKNIA